MRRIVFIVLTSGAIAGLSAPSALARHHHRGHHHRRARIERFGSSHDTGQQSSTDGSSQSSSSSDQDVGRVASFSHGVLAITLNDGSTVSGNMTDATELECPAPSSSPMAANDAGDSNGDNNGDNGGDNNGDNNGDNANEQNDTPENCATHALTPGTVVRDAVLEISTAGRNWDKVELASESSNPTAGGDDAGNDD